MTDPYDGIFDNITPEMFAMSTSCIEETPGTFRGVTSFNQSVDNLLVGVRTAFAQANGQVNPVAVLSNGTIQRIFVPEQDESLGDFLERLKREAALMSAHWLFFAKKNIVAVWYDDDSDVPDANSTSAMHAAKAAGSQPEVGVLWYAERREGEETHHRHGILRIQGNRITDATEGADDQTVGVFSLILDGIRQ